MMITMKVVNVKVAYIRKPEYNDGNVYQDLREWMADPDNVYIGRKGIVFVTNEDKSKMRWPPTASIWANPYKVSKDCTVEQCLNLYRDYILCKISNGEITIDDIKALSGKRLGCWCKLPDKDVPCHGDVVIDIVNAINNN